MPGLVFGEVVVCRSCNGSGGEHAFHVEVVGTQGPIGDGTSKVKPIRKHRPCSGAEHPCPACGGRGVIPLRGSVQ